MTAKKTRANGEGSIYEHRNGYAAYAWVNKPDGTRGRKYVYGKTKEDVHEKWVDLHYRAKREVVATKTPTLSQYLHYWLDEIIEPHRSPNTYANYEMFSRLYIIPGLGGKRLNKLSTVETQKWINKIAETCRCCFLKKDESRPEQKCCAVSNCCNDLPPARALSDIRNTLRAALSNAISQDLIHKNAASGVTLPSVRAKRNKPWSSDQARKFLESAHNDGDPLFAAYVLILVLGLRRGEALGLTWPNVDLDSRELTISHQLQRVRRQLLHRETKTEASDASLPLPAICVTALQDRQVIQEKQQIEAAEAWQESDLVFTTQLGSPIEPRNFNRSFHNRRTKAKLPKIKVHDARRVCASLLADLDVHPRVAMAILRHADFKVTMEIYTEASSKATKVALKRLGKSLEF